MKSLYPATNWSAMWGKSWPGSASVSDLTNSSVGKPPQRQTLRVQLAASGKTQGETNLTAEYEVMAKKKNQRKRSVVDKHVQWSLATRVLLHFFVFVCAGGVFGLINQFMADPFGGVEKNVMTFLRNSAPMFLALVCLMPIFVRDTLTLSNRIAGPIHNLKNTIRQWGDGETDVRPLRFRKGDFWGDLPELFNNMTDRLTTESQSSQKKVQSEDRTETSEQSELVGV